MLLAAWPGVLLLTQLPLVMPLHLLLTLLPVCGAAARRSLLPWWPLEACWHWPIGGRHQGWACHLASQLLRGGH
jgi:hypothetical protein